MFERLRNSNLAYVITLSACLNGVVGCGYFNGNYDTKFYKFQPTFEDRAIARSMITEQFELIDKSFKAMEPFLDRTTIDKTTPDGNSNRDNIKKALTDMVNNPNGGVKDESAKDPKHESVVNKCFMEIVSIDKSVSTQKNEEKIKGILNDLVNNWVGYENKPYTVNGMEFHVKNNCIYFDKLEISVPLKDIKLSDADVIGFSSDIQKALRWRMDTSRRVRLGSGSAQILAAAAGASLGLATGSVATAAALAAFSAVIPELQNIFQARDRSVAYEQGLEMIQDAESSYYQSRTASTSIPNVSTSELTTAGGKLLVQISACLKVVDKALLQTIPTIADLQAATGRLDEALGQIKVVPAHLNLEIDGIQTVQVINSKAFTYSVGNAGIVNVNKFDYDKGTDKFEIEGKGIGDAKVTVYNALGRAGSFDVTVGAINKNQTPKATTGAITTDLATKVGTTTATLYGTVAINGSSTDVWFEYGVINETLHKISSPQTFAKTGTFQVEKVVNDLTTGTLTSFRLVGKNSTSTENIYGNNQYFLTSKVTTGEPEHVSNDSATLTGEIITQDTKMDRWFVCYTKTVKDAIPEIVNLKTVDCKKEDMKENSGGKNKVSFPISELTPGTRYYYKLVAKNDAGEMPGNEKEFVTKGTSVQTGTATDLGTDVAILNGTVTTDCCTTKVWFEYGTESGKYGKPINVDIGTITKSTPTPVKAQISSLTPSKYYFRIATDVDKVNGTESSFEIK